MNARTVKISPSLSLSFVLSVTPISLSPSLTHSHSQSGGVDRLMVCVCLCVRGQYDDDSNVESDGFFVVVSFSPSFPSVFLSWAAPDFSFFRFVLSVGCGVVMFE